MSVIIKDLDTLLQNVLGPDELIKEKHFSRLTLPGDNYGSVMLKLDVTILNKITNAQRDLNLVAKTLPDTELYRELFQIQTTYTNEMAFYDIIIPTLQKFQTELGIKTINSFAKCYGTRKNLLENSNIINDDAVLLLENLKTQGFCNIDRTLGFNFETTQLILRETAQFHGAFLALKLLKPDIFNQKIRPYCQNYEPVILENTNFNDFYKKIFIELSKEDEGCLKLAPKVKFWGEIMRSRPREPFSTLIHADLWTNNTMQIFKDGKKAVANKFIDFQFFTYASPAADVFYFLWSSVQKPVLEKYLDFLLQFYYDEFIEALMKYKCDISPFSYRNFLEEIKLEADYEFSHSIECLFLLYIIASEDVVHSDIMDIVKSVPQNFKEKLWFMVKECNRRGYTNMDREIGFDFETTKLILTEIAQFHSSFLALKLLKREIFNKNVLPYCHNYEPVIFENANYNDFYKKIFIEISKEDEECSKLAPKAKFWGEILRSQPREPYATVIHTDIWTNNTMQAFKDGTVAANKFVDFQFFTYGSLAADVFFFMWTSVQTPVLENHLNFLLQFYHDKFIRTLKKHNIDISYFSYTKFLEELQLEAEYEFAHTIELLFVIHMTGDEAILQNNVVEMAKTASLPFKEKLWFMVKECNKRGWLY